MPENADLRRNVTKARKKEMFFAFVFGGTENKMIVDKKKVKSSQTKELKDAAKGAKEMAGS